MSFSRFAGRGLRRSCALICGYGTSHYALKQRGELQPGETLSTTALVNEAYLKLRRAEHPGLADRVHFFSLVARAMRQILIDHARSRLADQRRMREVERELRDRPQEDAAELARLLEIDSALDDLEQLQPRLAQVVLYRYFAGHSPQETADLLGVTVRTVNRDWHKARAWLALALDAKQGDATPPEATSTESQDPS